MFNYLITVIRSVLLDWFEQGHKKFLWLDRMTIEKDQKNIQHLKKYLTLNWFIYILAIVACSWPTHVWITGWHACFRPYLEYFKTTMFGLAVFYPEFSSPRGFLLHRIPGNEYQGKGFTALSHHRNDLRFTLYLLEYFMQFGSIWVNVCENI